MVQGDGVRRTIRLERRALFPKRSWFADPGTKRVSVLVGAAWNEKVGAQGTRIAKRKIVPIRPPGQELGQWCRARAGAHGPHSQGPAISRGTAGSAGSWPGVSEREVDVFANVLADSCSPSVA